MKMYIKAELKHLRTVAKHRWVVLQQCARCGYFWQGLTHDLSKLSRAEFVSSARYFQGDRSPIEAEKAAQGYSAAWIHHKGRNPHHWEYWTDFDEGDGHVIANKIPYRYVVEMVCDWIGAGMVYSQDKWTQSEPLAYYDKVRKGRHFHEETELLLRFFLEVIKDYGLDKFYEVARSERLHSYYDVGFLDTELKDWFEEAEHD